MLFAFSMVHFTLSILNQQSTSVLQDLHPELVHSTGSNVMLFAFSMVRSTLSILNQQSVCVLPGPLPQHREQRLCTE
ncbi:hypothetical protein DIPPA_19622 [Diplonema papillatum]|nr:hypothetical protein DIPPA_19622 [Diplonema papillatum]